MEEWNVIVTVREGGFKRAFKVLSEFGSINRTEFFNVLVMRAGNVPRMFEALHERIVEGSDILTVLGRMVPVSRTFDFQSPEEFEEGAKEIVLSWASALAGKMFHVRMHRRGFKGRLSTVEEERLLDDAVLQYLEKAGTPGRINFDDPDAIIAVETVGQQAGLSFWTREELQRYPFLGLLPGSRPEKEPYHNPPHPQ
jgi:tRNA(Ser,Leu) C12 N-acetylase TAN1